MTAHENVFNGSKIARINGKDELTTAILSLIPRNLTYEDVVFVCIGTDRSTGDSLGPLVGTYLTGLGYTNVLGTVDEPIHAMNLAERVADIPEGKTVIAIDACLGRLSSVGKTEIVRGSVKPGAGVNRTGLPEVGDYGITGVVNVSGFMEYAVLQNTRLSLVMRMARDITSAIVDVFPLETNAITRKQTQKSTKANVRKSRNTYVSKKTEVCV
jgi:putative sporulation protein YyaC